jgi:hypothetical protein
VAIKTDSLKGDLAIELDAESVSAADFSRALDAFLTLVKELTRQITDGSLRDAWLLTVQEGSQVVALRPNVSRLPLAAAAEVYVAMFDGLEALEREAKAPRLYTDAALESARDLSMVAQGRKDRGVPVRILTRTRALPITRNTYNHVSEILDWKYEDVGTVEGTLEVVSAHNGYEIRIYEPVWQRAVRCTVSEDLIHEALSAFGKRVEVQGLVRYTKDGFPVSVKALKITEFPDPKNLPSFRDVKGILNS